MQKYKKYIVIVLTAFILFLIFFTTFVLFDMFPNKYTINKSNQSELILETKLSNSPTIIVTSENNIELITAIINHSLNHIDTILTAISLLLSSLILTTIGLFNKKNERKLYITSIISLTITTIVFLILYYQEIAIIEVYT